MSYKKNTLQLKMIPFGAAFILLGALYIYGINMVSVGTLEVEAMENRIEEAEEEVLLLEAERARLVVGSYLEEQARAYNLVAGGPVHFVSRDSSVARLSE